jgi:lipopolysaccharide/colanic/teichoic acid biosynthesis glycosyltransferase
MNTMETIEIEKIKQRPRLKPKLKHIVKNQYIIDNLNHLNPNDIESIRISFKSRLYANGIKRVLELLLLLIIFIPALCLIFTISLLLLVPNKGKIFFRQERVGYKGQPFTLYKFRTLIDSIDIKIEKDAQIIKENTHSIGYFLRKTGLDEILQIINIMKGDMNLIGPRPLLMKDLEHLTHLQFYKRHMIKPGILGLWQIKRNYSDDINYFRYDNLYIKKQSLSLDFYIIVGTIIYMVKGKGR